ncbi:MAG: hypothetical protein KA885_02775 [Spirochaetes bacterium]|nr:hypothetical protein [Spirochaetota bacterium]
MRSKIALIAILFFTTASLFSAIRDLTLSDEVAELIQSVTALENPAEVKTAVDRWKDKNDLFPIVSKGYVNFLFFSDSTKDLISKVAITGDFNKNSQTDFLKRVGKTNLFYKTKKIKNADGNKYIFTVYDDKKNVKEERDYFNSNVNFDKKFVNIIRMIDSDKGTLQFIPRIDTGSELIPKRNIIVYLPPKYFLHTETKYPVIYMQDGQQLWDSPGCSHGGWKMDSYANELINNGKIEPIIIVGIYNSPKRNDEYMGWSQYHRDNQKEVKNKIDDPEIVRQIAEDYEKYMNNHIKPYIDGNFRTKPDLANTATGGASSGAMIALYMGFKNKDIYSKVAALSGGFDYYIDITKSDFFKTGSGLKIYLDCGTNDLDKQLLPATIVVKDELLKLDFVENQNLLYYIADKSGHNEKEWAKRVPMFLEFLFGKK